MAAAIRSVAALVALGLGCGAGGGAGLAGATAGALGALLLGTGASACAGSAGRASIRMGAGSATAVTGVSSGISACSGAGTGGSVVASRVGPALVDDGFAVVCGPAGGMASVVTAGVPALGVGSVISTVPGAVFSLWRDANNMPIATATTTKAAAASTAAYLRTLKPRRAPPMARAALAARTPGCMGLGPPLRTLASMRPGLPSAAAAS